MGSTERTSLLGSHPGAPSDQPKSSKTNRPLRAYLAVIPPSICGLALGVCGLGVTWQAAARWLLAAQWLRVVADCISLVCAALNVCCLSLRCDSFRRLLHISLSATVHTRAMQFVHVNRICPLLTGFFQLGVHCYAALCQQSRLDSMGCRPRSAIIVRKCHPPNF
jgi:hypothetical protein